MLREDGSVDTDAFHQLLSERTRIVALSQVSNSLGSVTPVAELVKAAREAGAWTLVDGAQAVGHYPVDVQQIGCDFYAFSGHKMFGPTGVGVLFGRRELLDAMPPYQTGGEMIETVSFEKSTWNQLPYKFEPGTPNIAGVIGLGAATRWLAERRRPADVPRGGHRLGRASSVLLVEIHDLPSGDASALVRRWRAAAVTVGPISRGNSLGPWNPRPGPMVWENQ